MVQGLCVAQSVKKSLTPDQVVYVRPVSSVVYAVYRGEHSDYSWRMGLILNESPIICWRLKPKLADNAHPNLDCVYITKSSDILPILGHTKQEHS